MHTHSQDTRSARRRIAAGISVAVLIGTAGVITATATAASAATCSDVEIDFARGTGEAQGLGSVGQPFVTSLTSDLSGKSVSSYAVVYDANTSQSSAGPGSTDLTNHVTSVAASCPNTRFVLGGYSQGATVVDNSLGIQAGTTTGTPLPSNLSSKIAAIVVFGNPLGLQGKTIATASATYGARSKDYCNTGDPVCGSGSNVAAHLQYASNGSTTAGATFAANLVNAGTTTPAPTPSASASSTPTPTPSATATAAPVACYTDTNPNQVSAGRANALGRYAYAKGSNDYLGLNSSLVKTSLKLTGTNTWSKVSSC